MKIAVIGTGNVGSALGRSLVRAGHNVTLVARDEQKTRAIADEIGASASSDVREATAASDVVVLAVPFGAINDVAAEVAPVAAGKVVIDTTNALTPDYSALATAGGPSVAEQLAARLPEARVVKGLNTLFASVQADPSSFGQPVDALFATDDDTARDTMFDLLESLDLRPVDAGPLARARELESLAWLNMSIQMRHGGDWRSAFVLAGAPEGATRPRDAVAA